MEITKLFRNNKTKTILIKTNVVAFVFFPFLLGYSNCAKNKFQRFTCAKQIEGSTYNLIFFIYILFRGHFLCSFFIITLEARVMNIVFFGL